MIVFRYLSREVLLTLSAVSAVLLVIIMSGRFIKYLAQAASGALDPGSLFLIMGFRLPGFLQLILPLGLFLEFVRAPASLLIGIWALLQVVFAYTGPAFGAVAWWAHIAGFLFGVVFALFVRAAIARRMRKRQGY